MTSTTGCATCNKSSLALLLLRPSPIARVTETPQQGSRPIVADLIPPGSQAIESVAADIAGIMPGTPPTESRIVLRTLRAGYVHIYIETPSVKWIVYRVTEQGDMVPHEHHLFDAPKEMFKCADKKHNAAGMKLVEIPQAHLTPTIWIAFSANLWNAKLREKNKKSALQMQQINLHGKSSNTFLPSAENLKKKVLECGLKTFLIDKVQSHDFPFHPVDDVDKLATQLIAAAGSHQKTKGKELAIVLSDPCGLATELNALRIRRYNLMQKEFSKPIYEHPLKSSNALLGLKSMVVKDGYERAARNLMHEVTQERFEKDFKDRTGHLLGAYWMPVPGKVDKAGKPLGRVWTNASAKQYEEQARRFRDANWANLKSEFNEGARQKWHEEFEAKMQELHLDSTAKFENDWWRVCRDARYKSYFTDHFDENDKNSPHEKHSPGLCYGSETTRSKTPQPYTRGAILDDYVAQIKGDIKNPEMNLLRTLGANQKVVIDAIVGFTAVQGTLDYLHTQRNDKLYDFCAALVKGAHEAHNPNKVQRAIVQYSWLSNSLGDSIAGYSLLVNQSLIAAALAIVVRHAGQINSAMRHSTLLRTYMDAMHSFCKIQVATDYAHRSIVAKTALVTPIIIVKRFPFAEGVAILGSRGTSLTPAKFAAAELAGFLDLELVTDNKEMRSFSGNIDNAIEFGAGKVRTGPISALLVAAPTERTIRFTDEAWNAAWKRRLGANAAFWLHEGIRDGHATIQSLEGRLALGICLLNGLQLIKNLNDISRSTRWSKKHRDALLGAVDAGASVIGGLCQVAEVASKASTAGRLGAEAAKRSFAIYAFRITGMSFGAFAGIVGAVSQMAKAKDAQEAGNAWASFFYGASGAAFFGTAITGSLAAVGAMAERRLIMVPGDLIARRLAQRYGAAAMASAMGLSVSGWGIVLLAAGVAFEIAAVMATPSELQKWVQRSYFGYGKTGEPKFVRGNWKEEEIELQKLVQLPE